MNKYKEIFRLKEMLEKENIPFLFRDNHDGFQILYPTDENRICSVIEHEGSYGHNQDRLEIMGLMTDEEIEKVQDDVLGYLTAEDVFNRIYKHYKGDIKMSFALETEKKVQELIEIEYKNACEQAGKEFNDEYTDKYHSLYEGYAVLLEEVEEVNNEFCELKSELDHFWYWIKKNDTESTRFSLGVIENRAISSMKELAQVGAVLMKIKNTLGKDTNVVTNDEVEE